MAVILFLSFSQDLGTPLIIERLCAAVRDFTLATSKLRLAHHAHHTVKKQQGKWFCNNFRRISPLSVTEKVLDFLIQTLAEKLYRDLKCGFRCNRSTWDIIVSMRQTHEEYSAQCHPLHIALFTWRKHLIRLAEKGYIAYTEGLWIFPGQHHKRSITMHWYVPGRYRLERD